MWKVPSFVSRQGPREGVPPLFLLQVYGEATGVIVLLAAGNLQLSSIAFFGSWSNLLSLQRW